MVCSKDISKKETPTSDGMASVVSGPIERFLAMDKILGSSELRRRDPLMLTAGLALPSNPSIGCPAQDKQKIEEAMCTLQAKGSLQACIYSGTSKARGMPSPLAFRA